ncbi:MAG: hypothetical protein KAG61_03205 [Bacteriovoracaceae bacterium]|nr:hypothetical protein [Bacteriovoracaceae bacterium]
MRKYNLTINNKNIEVIVKSVGLDTATVEVDEKEITVNINEIKNMPLPGLMPSDAEMKPAYKQAPARATTPSAGTPQSTATGGVEAPIPGLIKGLFVAVGDKVEIGQKVLVMEAMKMENEITAETAGTILKVLVGEGDNVAQGEQLLIIG